jgi:cytochrome c oxidase assembly protein subunit 15
VRGITGIAMALLWVIIPSGGFVRLTASGLGCTDWPLCENTSVIPAMDVNAWIEYTNRMLSGVVMLAAVLSAIVVMASRTTGAATRVASVIAAVATVGQVPLGAVTVVFELHPLLVASHFLLSLVALAGGVIAFLGADDVVRTVRRAFSTGAAWLGAIGALALITTLVSGVLTTTAGPHSGDPAVIERYGSLDAAAYWHVRAVILLGVVAIVIAIVARARRSDRGLLIPALLFIPLFSVQVIIGEVQWRTQLPWEVVVFHVGVAGLVWGVGVAALWRLARPLTGDSSPA